MKTFISQVGKGHVEKGGYVSGGRMPEYHVPYGKYREDGKLALYSPGWLQQTCWAIGHHHRMYDLESPVWEGKGSAGMKCFNVYERAQQRLAEEPRRHVAMAMTDERWSRLRATLDPLDLRQLRMMALSGMWNALGFRRG